MSLALNCICYDPALWRRVLSAMSQQKLRKQLNPHRSLRRPRVTRLTPRPLLEHGQGQAPPRFHLKEQWVILLLVPVLLRINATSRLKFARSIVSSTTRVTDRDPIKSSKYCRWIRDKPKNVEGSCLGIVLLPLRGKQINSFDLCKSFRSLEIYLASVVRNLIEI